MSPNRRRFVLAAILAIAITALAACGSDNKPAAAPESSPVPTPIPTDGITVDPRTDPAGFIASLPDDEAECAASAVGGDEVFLELVSSEEPWLVGVSDAELQVMGECFSDNTMRRVLVGQLELQAGGLTDETRACVSEHAAGINFAMMVSEEVVDPAPLASMMQAMFCLNAQERAAAQAYASGILDTEGAPIDALECAAVRMGGIDAFVEATAMFSDTAEFQEMPDLSGYGELMAAMIECGVVPEEEFEGLGLTAQQMVCLSRELDPRVWGLLITVGADPSFFDEATLQAIPQIFSDCGVDFESFMDRSYMGEEGMNEQY